MFPKFEEVLGIQKGLTGLLRLMVHSRSIGNLQERRGRDKEDLLTRPNHYMGNEHELKPTLAV